MEWIYEAYDKERRLKNILWTVSGDYTDELVKAEEYAGISDDLALYYAAKAGARRKYIDWKMIKGYLSFRIRQGVSAELMIDLAQLCCDQIVEKELLKDRPGLVEVREKAYQDLIEAWLLSHSNTLMDQVRYAVFFRQAGKSVLMDRLVGEIVREIEDNERIADSQGVIRKIETLYTKYENVLNEAVDYLDGDKEAFGNLSEELTGNPFDQNAFHDFMLEEYYSDSVDDLDSSVERIASPFLIESMGELKPDPVDQASKLDRVVTMDEETAGKLYDKIEYYYGKSFLTRDEMIKTEKKICRNTHEGCRVHFTDGVSRSNENNSFQAKYIARQKVNNMAFFNSSGRANKRNIMRLKENISRLLAKQAEITTVPSEYGVIVPSKLWKVGRTTNYKVFNKTIDNSRGAYVIDILLDGSGSQRERQGQVAAQGFILSEALTLAGIPNRVMSFCSFLDYTILRRFRDYDSPAKENTNIFEYQAVGNNRDGLAVQAACEALAKRDEENKILLVLSDGKPNDFIIAKNGTIRGDTSYRGFKAIKDTAAEVRKARKNGILVLGVFTGKEEDLLAEKYIYGKDFIYTRNIEKFAEITGIFLKRVIES